MAYWLQSGHLSRDFRCQSMAALTRLCYVLNKWSHSSFSTWIKFLSGKPGHIRWSSLVHQPPAGLYQVCNVIFGGCTAGAVYDLAHSSSACGLSVFWDLASHMRLRDTVTGQTPKWTTTGSEKDEFLVPLLVPNDNAGLWKYESV